MRTTRIVSWAWAGIALAASLALVLTACGGSGTDKAGGIDEAEPRVLTMANPNEGEPPAQLSVWAEEVNRLSDGTLTIQFENNWRLGEARYEAGTLEDVKAGKADMAWVGARAFDTVGVTSFQALVAPLLIDSYDLEARVFEQGIPEQMLEGVSELGLVGIGVLPGPMRKLLGVSKPFIRPADFEGEVVGLQDSAVADMTLRALGATPRAVPASAELDGLDAYEQQLGSIFGNQYDTGAGYVTANVNLWPRPLVLVMGEAAFESLTPDQQSVLREAATAAIPGALAAARAEDAEAVPVLCRRGLNFAVASENDVAELRSALEPVYAEIASEPQTKLHIDAVTKLKTQIAASVEAAACETAEPASEAASPIPDGTYEMTMTKPDWLAAGAPEDLLYEFAEGVFTMVLDSGALTVIEPNGHRDFEGSYTVFRDQIEIRDAEGTLTAQWSLDGESLTFTDLRGCCYVMIGSHPWVRTDGGSAPIEGVYRTTFTREALEQSPLLYELGEVNDQNWGDFTLTFDRGRVTFEQQNDVDGYSTSGTFWVDGDSIMLEFTDGGNAGEIFNGRWSLYQDTLTFTRDEALGILPTPYLIEPWQRAE